MKSFRKKMFIAKLKITFSGSREEVTTRSQVKLGMRLFSFGKCLNLICSNSFSLDINKMFRTWWQSMKFKIDLTLFYTNLGSLSKLLATSFLLQISSCKSFLWLCLYVEEYRKLELATLKQKHFGITLWSSHTFKNWRSKKAFLCLISVFLNFLINFNVWLPYLFLKTSVVESLDGNLSLVRKINTNYVTKIITTYCVQSDWLS